MPARLPNSVQEIADVIGRDLAMYLIGQLPRAYSEGHPSGEVILYVPKTLKPDHQLVRLLGWAPAMRMVRAFGGEILKPATCAHLYRAFRDESIRALLADGYAAAMLAEWFGVCERHVKNIAREMPREDRREQSVKTVSA